MVVSGAIARASTTPAARALVQSMKPCHAAGFDATDATPPVIEDGYYAYFTYYPLATPIFIPRTLPSRCAA